jgi:hypothetical protein
MCNHWGYLPYFEFRCHSIQGQAQLVRTRHDNEEAAKAAMNRSQPNSQPLCTIPTPKTKAAVINGRSKNFTRIFSAQLQRK